MPRDRIGNSVQAANRLGALLSNPTIRRDTVGGADKTDLYQFGLGNRSQLTVTLTAGATKKLGLQLFSLKGAKAAVLKAIGRRDFDELSRRDRQRYLDPVATFQATRENSPRVLTLDTGDYYLRVFAKGGSSTDGNRYTLSVAAVDLGGEAPPTPSPVGSPAPSRSPSPKPSASPSPKPKPGAAPAPTATPTPVLPIARSWIKQSGGAQNDYTYSTAADSTGNVYMTGVMNSTGIGTGDAFVSKYDSAGALIWQRILDIPGADIGLGLAVDSGGNYYVAGAGNLSSTGSDGFVAKYSSTGEQLWRNDISTLIGTVPALDVATGVALDSSGNVYISGFRGAIPLSSRSGNAFIAKYDGATGAAVTSFDKDGFVDYGSKTRVEAASSIAVSADGMIYLTGITDAAIVPTASSDPRQLFSGGNAFVAAYRATDGGRVWNSTLKTSGQEYGRSIAITDQDVYIVGQTDGSLSGNTTAGGMDGFLARFNRSSGKLQWVKQFGNSGDDSAQSVAVASTGQIFVVGETKQALFGDYAGGSDAWIAQYDSSGTLVKSGQLGTDRDDEAYGVTVSGSTVYLVGQSYGAFPGELNQGMYDLWIAKLDG